MLNFFHCKRTSFSLLFSCGKEISGKEILEWDPDEELVYNWEILVFRTLISTTEGTEWIHPHEWINSGIRQGRNTHAGSFLSSSLLPEEDQSSNYFYTSSRMVKEKGALLSAPSFPKEKRDWTSPRVTVPLLCACCVETIAQVRWWGTISLQMAAIAWISPLLWWRSPWAREQSSFFGFQGQGCWWVPSEHKGWREAVGNNKSILVFLNLHFVLQSLPQEFVRISQNKTWTNQ